MCVYAWKNAGVVEYGVQITVKCWNIQYSSQACGMLLPNHPMLPRRHTQMVNFVTYSESSGAPNVARTHNFLVAQATSAATVYLVHNFWPATRNVNNAQSRSVCVCGQRPPRSATRFTVHACLTGVTRALAHARRLKTYGERMHIPGYRRSTGGICGGRPSFVPG